MVQTTGSRPPSSYRHNRYVHSTYFTQTLLIWQYEHSLASSGLNPLGFPLHGGAHGAEVGVEEKGGGDEASSGAGDNVSLLSSSERKPGRLSVSVTAAEGIRQSSNFLGDLVEAVAVFDK